eukprot:SAG31_NODE_9679_length_1242_cov_2.306212_1_plen_74_part_10
MQRNVPIGAIEPRVRTGRPESKFFLMGSKLDRIRFRVEPMRQNFEFAKFFFLSSRLVGSLLPSIADHWFGLKTG